MTSTSDDSTNPPSGEWRARRDSQRDMDVSWVSDFDRRQEARDKALIDAITERGATPKTTPTTILSVIGATVAAILGVAAIAGYLLMPRADFAEEKAELKSHDAGIILQHNKDQAAIAERVKENATINRHQTEQHEDLETRVVTNEQSVRDLWREFRRRLPVGDR